MASGQPGSKQPGAWQVEGSQDLNLWGLPGSAQYVFLQTGEVRIVPEAATGFAQGRGRWFVSVP